MKFGQLIGVVALLTAFAQSARAEDATTFTAQVPLYGYTSGSQTVKPTGGTEAKAKTTGMTTSDLSGSYLEGTWGKFNLYVYPFFANNKLVSGSYMVMDTLEVGLDLGLNS